MKHVEYNTVWTKLYKKGFLLPFISNWGHFCHEKVQGMNASPKLGKMIIKPIELMVHIQMRNCWILNKRSHSLRFLHISYMKEENRNWKQL